MLIKLMMSPIWLLLDFICSFLPEPTIDVMIDSIFFDVLGYGISVIGLENFVKLIGSVVFWYMAQLVWAVIEWIYKKIPGVS